MAMSAAIPAQDQELNLPWPPSGRRLRSLLAAAVRSIGWSYAIYWSVSADRQGVLTWGNGFYNGEVKTRKLSSSSAELGPGEALLQRSEKLRELYVSLLSGEFEHRARRPAASLSPEDLGDTEWYYTVCMTYTFRPGQGLPGRSFAGGDHVWLCNAQLADTVTFQRALLAKTASIQTVVCIPSMGGVLELGTTDTVEEDSGLVNRIGTSFWAPPWPEVPTTSSPSADEGGGEADIVFEDLDHSAAMILGGLAQELPEDLELGLSDASLERISREIDGLYGALFSDELGLGAALAGDVDEDDSNPWAAMDDGTTSLDVSASSPEEPAAAAAAVAPEEGCRSSCFAAWKRPTSECSDDAVGVAAAAVATATGAGASQKLLMKALAGGAWTDAARAHESSSRSHVMSERRRREKLNKMFLVLKSLVPSIHKMDKASILVETIAYLKELEKKVQQLEASREEQEQPSRLAATPGGRRRRHDPAGKKLPGAGSATKRKAPDELDAGSGWDQHEHRHCLVVSSPSDVSVAVVDKEVVLEVRCRWKELLMARVFDAVKSLRLDVVSVQASTPDGLLELKIRAQVTGSVAVEPGMISEALHKAIGKL